MLDLSRFPCHQLNGKDWNQDGDWYYDESSWDDHDWNQEWIDSLGEWSGDWSRSDDDWSYWAGHWSWNTQKWWNAEQPNSTAACSSQGNVRRTPGRVNRHRVLHLLLSKPPIRMRPNRSVRGKKPGLMTNLFVGACLLIGALSAGVPPVPAADRRQLGSGLDRKPIDVAKSHAEFFLACITSPGVDLF